MGSQGRGEPKDVAFVAIGRLAGALEGRKQRRGVGVASGFGVDVRGFRSKLSNGEHGERRAQRYAFDRERASRCRAILD